MWDMCSKGASTILVLHFQVPERAEHGRQEQLGMVRSCPVNKTKRRIEKGNGLLRGHSQATQVGVDAGKRFKGLRKV